MTTRQRKWLIIGVMLAAALTFVLIKAVPIGMRMYAYSTLDESVLAVPVVAVECEDRRDSTEGTLIDLGYAEFRVTGDVALRRVVRSKTTGSVEMVSFDFGTEQCIVFWPNEIARLKPIPSIDSTRESPPVGYSAWIWEHESCERFRREFVEGWHDEDAAKPAVVRTFEFSMLVAHVRPLGFMEIARMSDADMERYLLAAQFKSLGSGIDYSAILFHRAEVAAIAEHYSFWILNVWVEGHALRQQFYLPTASDELARHLFGEIVSTYHVKTHVDATGVELRRLLDEAYKGN